MASFAKLDVNNVVTQVDRVNNAVIQDENGIEQESLGIAFLRNHYNEPDAKWVQTSYNTSLGVHKKGGTPLRMNYASIGGTYDPDKDILSDGGNGGNGVVILRMPTSNYSGTTTGSPSVTTDGSDTILTFTGNGSYTT